MTETVYIPPDQHPVRRGRGTFIPPLLIIPFLIYNVVAFLFYGGQPEGWATELFSIPMVSGERWALTSGDLMLIVGLVCLFFEVLKSTQSGRASVLEHMLSTGVFIIFLIEFLLVPGAASSVFFLLMIISLIDVVAGFTVSITSAGRDVTMT